MATATTYYSKSVGTVESIFFVAKENLEGNQQKVKNAKLVLLTLVMLYKKNWIFPDNRLIHLSQFKVALYKIDDIGKIMNSIRYNEVHQVNVQQLNLLMELLNEMAQCGGTQCKRLNDNKV